MRDPTKLRAFLLADELALAVYRLSRRFPADERFGLTSQVRRGGVSVASNIVEGCARSSLTEYVRFLGIAYGAACELEYQLSLASRLGLAPREECDEVAAIAAETSRVLAGLVRALAGARGQARG